MGAAPFLGVVPVDPALGRGPDAGLLQASFRIDKHVFVAGRGQRTDQGDLSIRFVLPNALIGEAE